MSAIAMVGAITIFLKTKTTERLLPVLVAFAAGSLLGGAFLHMIPAADTGGLTAMECGLLVLAGFTVFLALEQLFHWHHCRRADASCRKPLGYLVLIGDGLHNFLGGMAVAGAALIDLRLGMSTWFAAAAHEIPQELGDFGVLVHSGWDRRSALALNVLSALTFPLGGLVTWAASHSVDVTFLVPFAAGNFIYIGASDLVPEVSKPTAAGSRGVHLTAFVAGVVLMGAVHWIG